MDVCNNKLWCAIVRKDKVLCERLWAGDCRPEEEPLNKKAIFSKI